MNPGKQPHARAVADELPARAREPRDAERLVTGMAVAAVVVAALLATVMHTLPATVAACGECGVVEAVVPLGPAAATTGTAWRMSIRMDDGTLRTVEQRRALAAGARVTVAGGSIRVLSHRPGPG